MSASFKAFCCLAAMREFQQKHTGSNIAILCGDFNTEPHEAAYELIVSGNIGDENKKKIQAENHIKVRKFFFNVWQYKKPNYAFFVIFLNNFLPC